MDISKYKIPSLGTVLNSIPLNIYFAVRMADIPNHVNSVIKLLSSIEGHIDGSVDISRIIIPNNITYNLVVNSNTVIEKHSKNFIAIIAKHNWIAIDVSALAYLADTVDELCQQGQHFVQGTNHCVNCGTPFMPEREIHYKDRMHDVIPEMLPAKVSEKRLFEQCIPSSSAPVRATSYNAAQSFLKSPDNAKFPSSLADLKRLLAEFLEDQKTGPNVLGFAEAFKRIEEYVKSSNWASLSHCRYTDEFVIQTLKDYERQAELEFNRISIDAFAKINLERCDAPKPQGFGGHKDWKPDNWTNAVCGEGGEAANKAKKFSKRIEDCKTLEEYIQFCETTEGQNMLRDIAVELADTITYSLIAIQKFGFDPTEVLVTTFNTVSLRENMTFIIK